MAIPENIKHNFNTLCKAIKNNDTAIVEITRKDTNKSEFVVAIVNTEKAEYVMFPMARLFTFEEDDNPFEIYIDPTENEKGE